MKYNAILVDPPVPFKVWSKPKDGGRTADSHYPTMTWEQLNGLGPWIRDVAAKDCCLFLWVCQPLLIETLEMATKHWGFTYKTKAFAWVKTNKIQPSFFSGMGYWTRANTEDVLLFTRGKPQRQAKNVKQAIHHIAGLLGLLDGKPRMRKRVPTVISPFTKHSQKPSQIHTAITQLVDGPYLELFGRRPVEGWTVLGNEIDGRDIHDALTVQAERT